MRREDPPIEVWEVASSLNVSLRPMHSTGMLRAYFMADIPDSEYDQTRAKLLEAGASSVYRKPRSYPAS